MLRKDPEIEFSPIGIPRRPSFHRSFLRGTAIKKHLSVKADVFKEQKADIRRVDHGHDEHEHDEDTARTRHVTRRVSVFVGAVTTGIFC
jgi:hypothetical protein